MPAIETTQPPATRLPTAGGVRAAALPAAFVVVQASGYLVGTVGAHAASPFTLLFWRFAVATVVMTAVAVATRAPWPRGRAAWLRLLVTGVLLQTAQFGGVYLGLAHGVPAGMTALVISASPLLVAALGIPLFGERLRPRQWLGFALGLAGVGAAVASGLGSSVSTVGISAVALGLVGFSAGTLWQKKVGTAMDLRTGTAVQLLGATVTTIPLTAALGGFALPVTPAAIGSVLWLAIVCSLGAFVLLFVLLRSRSGGAATSYLFLVPPLTSLLAVPLLGQPLSVGALGGIALAMVGVALVTRARPAS